MAKKQDKTEGGIVAVEEALSKTERFIENNQKILTIVIGVIVVIVLIFFGFKRFYMAPREQEAREQMYMAQQYFEMDSLNLALDGDGMYPGFLRIIDDYGMTKGADLSKYYTGVCYLKMGNYEEAINYLKSFKAKDQVLGPMAKGGIGDAYMELNQPAKAAGYYIEAADSQENEFTTPLFLMKAGWTYEIMKDYIKAVSTYERIKYKFPTSNEAREIDKYIARAKGLM
ncbi:MAG: tetratricopeptide repeat protein [Bacteroidales bacterium]|nr:tetratricopeptide repeat protein [Bacteroidales bacterium]